MSRAASWLPLAVADRLRAHDRSESLLLAWLATLRAQIEDYEVRPPSPEIPASPESVSSDSPDSAFDEILSQLGNEIYKLDEYQRHLTPADERTSVSHSILDLFDECLCDMTATDGTGDGSKAAANGVGDSEDESTLSEVSFVTSTPVRMSDELNIVDVNAIRDKVTPLPLKAVRPLRAGCAYGDRNVDVDDEPRPTSAVESLAGRLETDSDSESTCWSYKDCSTDTENDERDERYAAVWAHSSGYHNSDQILRRVLAQHRATESRLSFHMARELPPPCYSVYALPEPDGRWPRPPSPVAEMTPGAFDGYEPVGRALDENIYEEIDYGGSYTDEGCSCEGSVEVESCSVSAGSEAGRESPVYANLRDHDAYAIPPDVIAWKNLLLHPDYNDDEEDVWITPEECAVFAQEPRPPFVIPRISHHRTRALRSHQPFNYAQESPHELRGAKPRQYGLREWSPQMQRPCAPGGSPVFTPPSKRLGGSTENLIAAARRPSHLPLPASSSDSIDVDLRDRRVVGNRNRKSRSVMVAAKERLRSPIPAPRMLLRTEVVETPVHEGPVKRTKFAESGKKVRKHWTDCYMILTQTALKCYKDQKTYEATKSPKPAGTPPSPTAPRAELELPLKNGHIMPCNHQHTSRFARSVILTVGYNQYLIQDETKDGAKKWLELIQDTIYELGPSTKPAEYSPYQSSNTDLESLGRTPPAVRNASRMKQKAGGSSNEDLPDNAEASYVRSRLKKFFAKRTALEVLVDKGIYKDEQAFGNSLERVCPSTPPRVPKFVVRCIEEIEKTEENMCTDGLYRASGNLSQVQKIRLEIDQNNWSVIENNPDIHVLTGSLKLFFRELKEPLIPCKFFDRVLAACSIKPREARTKEFREIVRALPACNRDTLKYLLEHLLRVTTYSEKNRMHTANLAIVFGPTLLWAPAEQAHNIALDCIQQNNVVDILLTDFKEIFAEDTGKNKKLA